MKIVGKNEKECILCGTCEAVCSGYYFKEEDREKSAIQVSEVDEDPGVDINVCNQCGTCIRFCPVIALSQAKSGTVILNKKKCIACLNCVGACPTDSMFWKEEVASPFKCIACARCTKECPTEAIFMEEVEN